MAIDISLDEELRGIAFAFVQRLRDQYGGRIPRAELMRGVTFRGDRVPIWNYQKGIFKPAALGPDGAALSVQTSAESPYDDLHDPESGEFVYKYRGRTANDVNHPDNIALRRAMQLQRPLIYLVAVDPGFYDAVLPVYVTADDVHQMQFILAADQAGLIAAATDPVMTEVRRQYATRAVIRRLHQQQFRRRVLKAYREQCAVCRLKHKPLLDAAHILPDSDPRGEPVVSNGLGMCKIHHSAYDAQILGIDPEARVHIRVDVLHETDGPMLKYGLQEMEGARLELPRRADQRPNREFLAERFERFRAA